MTDTKFEITKAAAQQILSIIKDDKRDNLFFRVTVSGGGCSGFQYHFDLDQEKHEDDVIFHQAGAEIALDQTSLDILKGSRLDYITDLMGSYFKIENPNAKSACGCGNSFSL
jgi:iron-sulfur cluster insertion protein